MVEPENSPGIAGMEGAPAAKKKRNLPGMPDPDAEVIALSPESLLATNRFVCEVCGKGFQRDQNLQLHRRGHNLPWKLRQRTEQVRRRVYVCPEPTCVHHDPKRALGDLTGIKKHFCRKHGEKKWQCERCSKKYAVLSDRKAHMKTCGTKEYKCECGTLFSRKDSFTIHRAFCEALAEEESAKDETPKLQIVPSSPSTSLQTRQTPSIGVHSPVPSIQSSEAEMVGNSVGAALQQQTRVAAGSSATARTTTTTAATCCVFSSIFTTSTTPTVEAQVSISSHSPSSFSDVICPTAGPCHAAEPMSLSLSTPATDRSQQLQRQCESSQSAALSATALLQKAAQIGATSSSSSSFLRGLGLGFPSSSNEQHTRSTTDSFVVNPQWSNGHVKPESSSVEEYERSNNVEASGLTNPMVGRSMFLGNKPTTLDLFGLRLGSGGVGSSADRF